MNTRSLLATLLTGIAFASATFAAEAKKIAPADAARLAAEGKAVIVDCREPAEWADSGVAAPAVLLPKSDFDGDQTQWKEFLAKNRDKQIITYCRGGGRAAAIAGALEKQGIKSASIGGLKDWTGAGLPTRKAEAAPKSDAKAKK